MIFQSHNGKEVLIYDNSEDDAKYISVVCRSFETIPFIATSPSEAMGIVADQNISVAIVNFEMEKLELPAKIATIVTGDESYAASIKLIRYNPVAFLPRPIKNSMIKFTLIKAFNTQIVAGDFPTQMQNIYSTLKDVELQLKAIDKNLSSHKNLDESIESYCKELCPIAVNIDNLKDDEKDYETVDILGVRGTVMCNIVGSCKVHKFREHLINNTPEELNFTPQEAISNIEGQREGSLLDLTILLSKMYERKINELYIQKKDFCYNICGNVKNDVEFTPGDILLSESEQTIIGNVTYCNHKNCTLERFFLLESNTIPK